MAGKSGKRVVTVNATELRRALFSAGQNARKLAEKRFGPKPFRVADNAVNEVRRRLAPAVAKLSNWCQSAPSAPAAKRAKKVAADNAER